MRPQRTLPRTVVLNRGVPKGKKNKEKKKTDAPGKCVAAILSTYKTFLFYKTNLTYINSKNSAHLMR